jgi:hypothetical protein
MGLSVSYDDLANAMSGVPANLLGAPMDMAYMMTMQGNYPEMANMVQGRSQRPELREFPMSSDWLGESVGADVDSLPFILSSLLSPDGTDVAIPAAKLAASGRMDDLIQAMTVVHGSPFRWDKIDPRKVGTGEGAAAYGHGALYVAEDYGVGDAYRKNLSKSRYRNTDPMELLLVDGVPIQKAYDIDYDHGEALRRAIDSGDKMEVRLALQDRLDKWRGYVDDQDYPYQDYAADKVGAYESLIRDLDSGKNIENAAHGYLYELDLPDETIDKMLDWDKPLSEQPESF